MSNELEPIKKLQASTKEQFLSVANLTEADFNKEWSFMLQQVKDNPYLKNDLQGLVTAVANVAQTGLSLNPTTKLAYLVPRNGKVCLDPSYKGLALLVTNTGSVNSIEVNIVYQGDEIEVDMSSDDKIKKHVPYSFLGKEKGDIIGVYSLARLATGERHVEYMTRAEIEDIRDMSESYKAFKSGRAKSSIWDGKQKGEMYRKTVLKRHTKYLPRTDIFEKLEKAIELDNYAAGFDNKPTWQQIDYATQLIEKTYDPETASILCDKLLDINMSEYRKLVSQCERDKIDSFDTGDMSQKAISEKLQQKMGDDRA